MAVVVAQLVDVAGAQEGRSEAGDTRSVGSARAAAVVAATAAAGVGTGYALGWRDGIANDARNALADDDVAGMLAANRSWHRAGWVVKPLLVVDVAGGVAVGGLVEPDAWEVALLAASWGAGVGLGFHAGHNAQQGQRWDYFGEIDGSDRWARTVGPRRVVVAAVVIGVAVWAVTWWALSR